MILQRLRIETKEAHQALEKLIIPRIKNIQTTADYIDLLELFYGYFKPIEKLLDEYLGDRDVPYYSKRRKTASIISDIKSFDIHRKLDVCNDLPSISTPYNAIGALYVIEGSTLGGKIISKMILQSLSLTTASVCFFTGYGEKSDEMWSSFTDSLNNYTDNAEEQDQIARTANETFTKFKSWVEHKTLALQN